MEKMANKAENIIVSMKDQKGRIRLTRNQIRKFLSAVNRIENKLAGESARDIDSDQLPESINREVEYLKIRLAYQAGREENVKEFSNKASLMDMIDNINGSREKFNEFARFVEALVAYHNFHGGREN